MSFSPWVAPAWRPRDILLPPRDILLHTGESSEHSSREGTMDFHHVIEAAGIVALGLVFYSYARRWLESTARIDRRLRALVNGVFFGLLAITLMISRIQVGPGAFVDARAVPIALVTLVEGGWAGLVAAVVAAGYRAWLGGTGALAGVLWLLATAGTATLALAWARREGGVRTRHALALGGAGVV